MFRACEALKGHVIGSNDWKAAYLTAPLQGKRSVWARLPKELESEDGLRIIAEGGSPVHRVYKALYGLQRAGQDYAAHASGKLAEAGLISCRELIDQSPSQFFRAYDRETLETVPEHFAERLRGDREAFRSCIQERRRTNGEKDQAGQTVKSGSGRTGGSGN